jgi:hypothetical protein
MLSCLEKKQVLLRNKTAGRLTTGYYGTEKQYFQTG